jgi:hypothetical protein
MSVAFSVARVERAPSPAAFDFGVDPDLFYATRSQAILPPAGDGGDGTPVT